MESSDKGNNEELPSGKQLIPAIFDKFDKVDNLLTEFNQDLKEFNQDLKELRGTSDAIVRLMTLKLSFDKARYNTLKKIISHKPELSGLIDFDDFKIYQYCNAEYPLKNGEMLDITALIESPPISFIVELANSAFLSLFECFFLIGYVAKNQNMLDYSVKIAHIEIDKGIISPRDSSTNLMLNDLPPPKDIDGNPIPILPDLLSTLSFKEADKWAIETFHTSLKDLRDIQTAKQNELTPDKKPSCLNEDHPMFSRELTIAVEAWEQVLSSNPDKPKTGSRKKLITQWLENNHKELTSEAKERIAVMINPDGNGGTPKSQAF